METIVLIKLVIVLVPTRPTNNTSFTFTANFNTVSIFNVIPQFMPINILTKKNSSSCKKRHKV